MIHYHQAAFQEERYGAKMVQSVGTQVTNLQIISQSPASRALNVSLDVSGQVVNFSADSLKLSDQAQEILAAHRTAINTIKEGLARLQQADIDLARQRLAASSERVEFVRSLLTSAGPEQSGAIIKNLQSLNRELDGIASQLGQLIDVRFAQEAPSGGATLDVSISAQTELAISELNLQNAPGIPIEFSAAVQEQISGLLEQFKSVVKDYAGLGEVLPGNSASEFRLILFSALESLKSVQAELFDAYTGISNNVLVNVSA